MATAEHAFEIPTVAPDIRVEALDDIRRQGVTAFIMEADGRLAVENPEVYEFLGRLSMRLGWSREEYEAAATAVPALLELWERQAQVDLSHTRSRHPSGGQQP